MNKIVINLFIALCTLKSKITT